MEASRDQNHVTTLLAVSSVDGVTPVTLWADPTTHRLLTDAAAGVTGTGVANEIAYFTAPTVLASLTTVTYPSLTELSYVKGVTSAIQTQINSKAPTTSPTFAVSITGSYLTASEILITDASKNIISAPVATYPSLTELTYLKGVTSAIQTQLNGKQATGSYEVTTNKATDFSTLNNTLYPTTDAVATYVAAQIVGLLDYRGSYDASTNLFPATGGSGLAGAVIKGDFWIVSVPGTLGGTAVTAGDLVIALQDTPAQTAANWDLISNEVGYTPANDTLSNLGTVAINTTLASDTNNTDDLGTTTKKWANLFITTIGATATRVTKGWFTDLESTNMPTVGGTPILSSLTAPQFTTIELGHASDTTLSRSAAGQMAVEGVQVLTATNTVTETNKRKQPRVYSAANNASLTPEIDTYDIFHLTAMSAATTINNHSTSTPADGELIEIRFLDNGTARALTWDTNYVAKAGVALPTTTTTSKNLVCLFEYNSNLTKWNLLSSGLEA